MVTKRAGFGNKRELLFAANSGTWKPTNCEHLEDEPLVIGSGLAGLGVSEDSIGTASVINQLRRHPTPVHPVSPLTTSTRSYHWFPMREPTSPSPPITSSASTRLTLTSSRSTGEALINRGKTE